MEKSAFDLLQEEIATQLGYDADVEVPFSLGHDGKSWAMRFPAPHACTLDCLPVQETGDIIGVGYTPKSAFENACVGYHTAARTGPDGSPLQ